MKLKRTELAIIAVTLAFACFTGGYFAGRRSEVNVVTVQPERIAADVSASAASLPPDTPPEITGSVKTADVDNTEESDAEDGVIAETDPKSEDAAEAAAVEAEEPSPERETTETIAPGVIDYKKININTATKGELTDLPGIGEVLAGRIIEYREKNGGFRSIEEIKKVSGIGDKKFEAMRDLIYTD